MKRRVCTTSILLAALAAAPAVWAGPEIVKCVAPSGHITLTDQPCPAGSTVTHLESSAQGVYRSSGASGSSGSAGATGSGSDSDSDAGAAPVLEHYQAPHALPRAPARAPAGKKAEPRKVSMTRDIATLKEARAQWLLQDAGTRPRLAAN
jgi:hypothetical protein